MAASLGPGFLMPAGKRAGQVQHLSSHEEGQHEGSRSHPQDSTGRHCPVGKVLIQHEANPIVQFFAAETLSDSPNNRKARYFSLPKKNFDSVSSVWMDAFVLLKPFTVFRVYVDANILIQHMGIFSPEQ